MKNKINKLNKSFLSIIVAGMTLIPNASVFANGNVITNEPPQLIMEEFESKTVSNNDSLNKSTLTINNNESLNNTNTNGVGTSGEGLDKAEKYVSTKMLDVVSFLQAIIKPFIYITFMISAIMIILGIVGGSKSKFKGLLGMAFSVLVYIAVAQAPQIIDFLSLWLSS